MIDWADYYKSAYEYERNKNADLASRLADAEVKEEENLLKLGRLENNFIFKTAKAVAHPSKVMRHFKEQPNKKDDDLKTVSNDTDYTQECNCQKNPYGEWRKKNPLSCHEELISKYKSKFCVIYFEEFIDKNGNESFYQIKDIPVEEYPYVIFLSRNTVLEKEVWECVTNCFEETKCDLIYWDEDFLCQGERVEPRMKPDWSPDTLLSFFYFGNTFCINAKCLKDFISKTKLDEDYLWNIYHLCLYELFLKDAEKKGSNAKEKVSHISKVLSYLKTERLKENLIGELKNGNYMFGFEEKYMERKANLFCKDRIVYLPTYWPGIKTYYQYEINAPRISILIPSKDNPAILQRCLETLYKITDYDMNKVQIVVIDNGSTSGNKDEILKMQERLQFKYVYENVNFNFSYMINRGRKEADGEYLLLLNDDIEIIEKDWLKLMVYQCSQKWSGAVGAKLWYPTQNRIQHAGITNLQIGPGHKLTNMEDNVCYYYGRNWFNYNMSAVTAACLMVRTEVFDEAEGFDESFPIAYNDVDFCFRLLELGYYNVIRNDAVLVHHESLSRGLDESEEKKKRLISEKDHLYRKHEKMRGRDPFYNGNLTGNKAEYVCGFLYDYENRSKNSQLKKPNTEEPIRKNEKDIQMSVERSGWEEKQYPYEEDKWIISGWAFLKNADNAEQKMALEVTFRLEDSTKAYTIEVSTFPVLREDVATVFSGEKNVLLSGFTARISIPEVEKFVNDSSMKLKKLNAKLIFKDKSSKKLCEIMVIKDQKMN